MHDKNGTPLRVGDVVSVEYVITHLSPGEDFCNLSAKSLLVRKPDGCNEYYSGNAAVTTLVRRGTPSTGDQVQAYAGTDATAIGTEQPAEASVGYQSAGNF